MLDKLKLGVIGCGRWGRNIIRTLKELETILPIELAVVINKNSLENRKLVEEQFKVSTSNDLNKYINKLNVAFIATPENEHYQIARQLLSAHVHVFIEKPISGNLKEAEILYALAESEQVRLGVGHILLFNDCIEFIKSDLKQTGEKIKNIFSSRLEQFLITNGKTLLLGSLVHDFSIIDYLLQEMPACFSVHKYHEKNSEDIYISLEYPGLIKAGVKGSNIWPVSSRDFILWTDSSRYHYDGVKNYVKKTKKDEYTAEGFRTAQEAVSQVKPLSLELENFLECVLNDKKRLKVDKAHVLRVMRTLDMITGRLQEE